MWRSFCYTRGMKRFILGLGAVLVATFGMLNVPNAHAQNPNNFTIQSFDVDYYLGKDSEGRSALKTVEAITAAFPEYDQNHGIERAIPQKYDGHSVDVKIQSVTDRNGAEIAYSDRIINDNLVLRIGDRDTYVHGLHEYVITYTQRDVTRFFKDTNDDEFYWDVNGTQWAQPVQTIGARLHVAPSVAAQLTGKSSCYQGTQRSTANCTVTREESNGEVVLSAKAAALQPYTTMTLAVGFRPQTFAAYQPSGQEKLFALLGMIWGILVIISSIAASIAIIWLLVRRYQVMHRVKGKGTIVPEYLPPNDASVLLSAQVEGNSTADITAQLIDLAVRHYLKVYQTKDKTLFKSAEYELELTKDPTDLRSEEQRLLRHLFGKSNLRIGARFAMKKLQNNHEVGKKLLADRKQLRENARGNYGIFERAETEAKQFNKFGIVAIIIGIITLSPLVVVVAIMAFVFAHNLWPLTEKGVALRDYLAGLRQYISVAEQDRIKMLQSPEGAEKVGVAVDGSDLKQLVKLYERVLPYAVLFGIEKEWTKQLGAYYEAGATQPNWYSGNAAFNAVVFSSALSNFSSQSSSYSSASSSSSGGSGGGGFAGGGGGGGGGGGW